MLWDDAEDVSADIKILEANPKTAAAIVNIAIVLVSLGIFPSMHSLQLSLFKSLNFIEGS